MISVIVPVYNVEQYLDRCVESIINQTYKNLEIILVDDGSPDNCPAMCDAWAKKDNRIKVIHKANGGLSDARNAGMAIATGELIGFVDSDDWISPDMYQHLHDLMATDNSDIAACGVEMVWEDGTPSCSLTKSGCCVLNQEEAMQAIIEESWLKQPVWYKLYKTKLIQDIPFPVGQYHEDVFWSYQAVGNAQRVSVSDKVCYYYAQRSGSIMGVGYSLKRLDAIEAKRRRQDYLAKNFPQMENLGHIDLAFSCLYHGQLTLKNLIGAEREKSLSYLKLISRMCGISKSYKHSLPVKQRVWLSMSRHSFALTCRLRNIFGIGM